MPATKNGENNLLTSWKEIAAYLGVDERTCQRWEKKYGLPVRRMEDTPRSRVSADKEDLDRWREAVIKNGNFVREFRQAGPTLKIEPGAQNPIKRYILLVLGILVIATLLFIFIPRFFYDRQPADFRIDHSSLIILNKSGKEVWQFDTKLENLLDEKWYRNRFQTRKFVSEELRMSGALLHLIIQDLDGCGRKEVLFAPRAKDEHDTGSLFCFNYKKDLLWEFNSGREFKFGPKKYFPEFAPHGFIIDDLNHDYINEIVFIAHCWQESPTQVVLLDCRGKALREYWNFGHINDISFMDLNGDGTKEIFLAGQNNEYQAPFLAVLDIETMKGCSPQSEIFQCKELDKGSEKYYILFPLTELEMLYNPGACAGMIDILPNRLFSLHVIPNSPKFALRYDFSNLSQELPYVLISHSYEIAYMEAFRDGKLSACFDNKSLQEWLMKRILYHDGKTKTWVNHPAMSNPW